MFSWSSVHASQAVVDNHRHFVGERRIVGDAVGDDRRKHVAVAILVLQAFSREGPAGGPAHQEADLVVPGRPGKIAKPLETEHGVVDEEGDHADPMIAVGRTSSYPGAQRTRFGDPSSRICPFLSSR